MAFSQMLAIRSWFNQLQKFLDKNQNQKNKKLTLKLGIKTYQILTNDDEVCIPSLSSISLAVSMYNSVVLKVFIAATSLRKFA